MLSEKSSEFHYTIFTDGACSNNQKSQNYGGWGTIVLLNGTVKKELKGGDANTSNNKMELFAVIQAFRYIQNHLSEIKPSQVRIYTDSAYIVNCFKQKWYVKWEKNGWKTAKGKKVKNKPLWEEIIMWYRKFGPEILKVQGHSGNIFNERADSLAREGINLIKSQNFQ